MDNYVYKKASNNYIVKLKKLPDTITNESRYGVVNQQFAEFRGNMFYVEKIYKTSLKTSLETSFETSLKTKLKIQSLYDKLFIYEVGKIVKVDDFDLNLENLKSTGIHYFKTEEAAFYYDFYPTYRYTGKYKIYYDNGQLMQIYNLKNGAKYGFLTSYNEDGELFEKFLI